MVKMLSRIGNSYGLIIDRAILDLLDIDPDTPLEVTTERGGLFVRPVSSEAGNHKDRVRRSATRMARIHQDTLRKLAE
jgi:antitoxin component of MazEF toxin-antitoxin module